jgi:hypothetical protein
LSPRTRYEKNQERGKASPKLDWRYILFSIDNHMNRARIKHLLLILISFVALLFLAEAGRACTCIEYEVPVCAAYWRADAVFAGQILDITPVQKKPDQMPTVTLHFIVEQAFRGISGNRVEVETLKGTSCDMPFAKGERYLIYASRDAESKQLFAGACSRTTELKHAEEDLKYINEVIQKTAKESVMGRVVENRYQPLLGVKITVQSDEKTLEAYTDANGDFSIPVTGPGNYKVRAFIPFAAAVMAYREDEQGKLTTTDALSTFEYEVQISRNQCYYRQLDTFKVDLHATAEVSGNVITASGRGLTTGYVYLVDAEDPDARDFKRLDGTGSFKFEGVAVGEYYLVLNPSNEPPGENDAPYPRTYYPQAPEANGATRIVVTEGAKLEHLTLRLGRPWKKRVVKGTVRWQDGEPARGAHVSVYDGERYVRLVKVDEKGRFNFKVYGEFKYAIAAEGWGQSRGRSDRVPIADNNSAALTLVLKPVD